MRVREDMDRCDAWMDGWSSARARDDDARTLVLMLRLCLCVGVLWSNVSGVVGCGPVGGGSELVECLESKVDQRMQQVHGAV